MQVDGEFAIDAPLTVHVEKPNGEAVTVHAHLMRIESNRELTWGGGIRGIFYGEHVFLLEALADGSTKLIHKEDFTGIAVRFVTLEAIDEGYALMNAALKTYVEAA